MPILIHGKQYISVAERVKEAGENFMGLETEVLQHEPVVVIKATATIKGNKFTGISAANPAKAIEKSNPYEVAETSAVGRALGFAGYGIIEGIASADEMAKADPDPDWIREDKQKIVFASDKQVALIGRLLKGKGQSEDDLKLKYKVDSVAHLPIAEASMIIDNLIKLPDKDSIPERQINEVPDETPEDSIRGNF